MVRKPQPTMDYDALHILQDSALVFRYAPDLSGYGVDATGAVRTQGGNWEPGYPIGH